MGACDREQDGTRPRVGSRRPVTLRPVSLRPSPRCGRQPRHARPASAGAFSLIELIIVVVIVGIVAAIAIPRFTGASESAIDGATAADLETLRKAIDVYQGEHMGKYPELARINEQLTQYTDVNGNVSPTRGGAYTYGPYVRAFPPLRVGPNRGCKGVADAAGVNVGWVYDERCGHITAAADGVNDRRGRPYGEY